jgi:hypothetical protein
MVTPIEAVRLRSRSPKLNGDFSALRICSAVSAILPAACSEARMTPNWSPPRRATVSSGRMMRAMRREMASSTESAAE